MSMAPNNPFEQQNSGGTPVRKKKTWVWVLGILGALGVIGAMVCCGGAWFAYRAGTGALAGELQNKLQGNPVIDEHIGEIESMSMNFSATVADAQAKQEQGVQGEERIIFDIEGTKGSGQIVASQDLQEFELTMPDGNTYTLEGAGIFEPADFDPSDIDMGEVPSVLEEIEIPEATGSAN